MSEQPTSRPAAADAAVLAVIEQQRQQQLALSADVQAALVALFAAFPAAYGSGQLGRWVESVTRVVTAFGDAGWEMSRRGYLDLRRLARVGGLEPSLPPIKVNGYRLWLDLRDHVVRPYGAALQAGVDPAQAANDARAQAARRAQKHALEPGRRLVHEQVDQAAVLRGAPPPPNLAPAAPETVDRQLVGWVRTTDGDPCYFCGMLASRGAVYASLEAAEFRRDGELYHPGCGCKAYPVFTDNPTLPEINYEMGLLWREAQESPPPGERLDTQKPREGSTARPDAAGRQARNNFRRLLAQRSREMRRAQGAPDSAP